MENEVKLKIEEWELLVQVKILDPDGFDRTNPNLFNEKFTYKEFKKGMDCSTQKSMTHEEWTSQYERLLDSNKHEPQVIAKTAGIEFRPNFDNIDEIVTDNCRLHLEYMDNDLIWMDIELPNGDEYHINIYHKDEKCHKHLKTSGEKVG